MNPWRITYIVLLCTTPFVLIFGVLMMVTSKNFIAASRWHAANGNSVRLPDYDLQVSKWWWQSDLVENDDDEFKSVTLQRANINDASVIIINRNDPKDVPPAKSEQQLLDDIRTTISEMNKDRKGPPVRALRLEKGAVKLYCFREFSFQAVHITCRTPNSPYIFVYSGELRYERECIGILQSLTPVQ